VVGKNEGKKQNGFSNSVEVYLFKKSQQRERVSRLSGLGGKKKQKQAEGEAQTMTQWQKGSKNTDPVRRKTQMGKTGTRSRTMPAVCSANLKSKGTRWAEEPKERQGKESVEEKGSRKRRWRRDLQEKK